MSLPPPSEDAALDALFAAAREDRPDTSRAEYGFETRLWARLADAMQGRNEWTEFVAWCWRLMPVLSVFTVAACVWAMWPSAAAQDEDLTALLAAGWPSPI